jgi:Domain of unknown function (DUF4917)
MKLIDFDEAFESAEKLLPNAEDLPALLLGNGFSMALDRNIFGYKALMESANWSDFPSARQVLDELGTTDFEAAIKVLQTGSSVIHLYPPHGKSIASRMKADAEFLKEALVTAIATRHPDHVFTIGDKSYTSTVDFIGRFGPVFTLNYDLLLYWTLNKHAPKEMCRDGFWPPGGDSDRNFEWSDTTRSGPKYKQRVHFVHGGLHLFESGGALRKIVYDPDSGQNMKQQILERIKSGTVPLFVCEGSSQKKLQHINSHRYLTYCLNQLQNASRVLFTFGLRFSESDDHILRTIFEGPYRAMYVSVYGDADRPENQEMISKLTRLSQAWGKQVSFYNSDSVKVWTR